MSTKKLKEARITIGDTTLTEAQSAMIRVSVRNTKDTITYEKTMNMNISEKVEGYLASSIEVEDLILGDVGAAS